MDAKAPNQRDQNRTEPGNMPEPFSDENANGQERSTDEPTEQNTLEIDYSSLTTDCSGEGISEVIVDDVLGMDDDEAY